MRTLVAGHPPSKDYRDGVLDALYVSQGMEVLIDLYGVAADWPRKVRRIKTTIQSGRPELVVSFGLNDTVIEAREAGIEVYVMKGKEHPMTTLDEPLYKLTTRIVGFVHALDPEDIRNTECGLWIGGATWHVENEDVTCPKCLDWLTDTSRGPDNTAAGHEHWDDGR